MRKMYSRVVGGITLVLLIIFFVVVTSMQNFDSFTIELSPINQFYFLLVISLLITIWFYLREELSKQTD